LATSAFFLFSLSSGKSPLIFEGPQSGDESIWRDLQLGCLRTDCYLASFLRFCIYRYCRFGRKAAG